MTERAGRDRGGGYNNRMILLFSLTASPAASRCPLRFSSFSLLFLLSGVLASYIAHVKVPCGVVWCRVHRGGA
jgi:hypothetical protein